MRRGRKKEEGGEGEGGEREELFKSVVVEGEGVEGAVALVKGQSRRRLWSFERSQCIIVY